MNRELKFRAWDKEAGRWYAPTHEAHRGNLFELFIGFSGDLCAHTMHGMSHQSTWSDGRFIVSQFTGLKDSYAKEVYDGDRVGSFDSDGNKWATGIVCFVNGTWYVKREWNLNSSVSDPFDDGLWEVINTEADIRVIGNIHENPELIRP